MGGTTKASSLSVPAIIVITGAATHAVTFAAALAVISFARGSQAAPAAHSPPPPPPIIAEVLTTPGGSQGDELGRSVAVSGPFIAGGRWLADPGGNTNAGAVRIWRRGASNKGNDRGGDRDDITDFETEVTAPDGAANDEFGVSVGLTASCDPGDPEDDATWPRLIVGAWSADLPGKVDAGAAYIYRRDPTSDEWSFEAKLIALDGAASNQFGRSVSIDGSLAVVGAWQHLSNRGAIYVFRRNGGTWIQESKLLAADGTIGDGLGVGVAIDGDRVIGGAWGDDTGGVSNHGSAYIFRRNAPGNWVQEAKCVAPALTSSEEFGRGVAIDGDSAIIGSWPFFSDGPGAAFVFTRNGAAWAHQATLTHPNPAAADYFGFSVDISGEVAVIGAWADDVSGITNQGTAHVFARSGSSWQHWVELTRPQPQASAYFGFSVAIDGTVAAVGSRLDDLDGVVNIGSVTVVCIDAEACSNCPAPSPTGDLNGDGLVNGADLALLLGAWGASWTPPEPPVPSDINGDGTVGGADLALLLGAWTG